MFEEFYWKHLKRDIKKNDELFILLLFKKHPCVTYFFEKNRLFEWTNKM